MVTHDTGLGTAYERHAVYRLLERWFAGRPVATAFEGPIDGMAGIPGLHLVPIARAGGRVTVALPDEGALEVVGGVYRQLGLENRLERIVATVPDAHRRFDLVLTYNALPLVPDWRAYLRALVASTRRYLIVSVTNPYSYGVYLRRAMRLLERDHKPALFDHESTREFRLEPELATAGRLADHVFLDCPWWPDLFVDTGETLFSGSLRRIPAVGSHLARALHRGAGAAQPSHPVPFEYGPHRFPFFGGEGWHDEMQPALERHPVFDDFSLSWRARVFGHHHAYLVELAG